MFYTDENIKTFVETYYPEYMDVFNQFEYPIQRADFFRYLVIYKFGGFYFDSPSSKHQNGRGLAKLHLQTTTRE